MFLKIPSHWKIGGDRLTFILLVLIIFLENGKRKEVPSLQDTSPQEQTVAKKQTPNRLGIAIVCTAIVYITLLIVNNPDITVQEILLNISGEVFKIMMGLFIKSTFL